MSAVHRMWLKRSHYRQKSLPTAIFVWLKNFGKVSLKIFSLFRRIFFSFCSSRTEKTTRTCLQNRSEYRSTSRLFTRCPGFRKSCFMLALIAIQLASWLIKLALCHMRVKLSNANEDC